MNNIVLGFMGLLFFGIIGCDREHDTSFVLHKVLLNTTNKTLFYSVKTNVKYDSVFSFGNDSIGMTFIHYGKKKIPFIGPYSSIKIDGVSVRNEVLYNLNDTTFFLFNVDRLLWTKQDSVYWSMVVYKVDEKSTTYQEQHMETLFVKDILLSLMQKDYTMLEKFKDYYATLH